MTTSQDSILMGIEQEFRLYRRGRRIDFRDCFHDVVSSTSHVSFLAQDLAVLADAGYTLSCDDAEAEFSTAPVALEAEGPDALVEETLRCREHMLDLLAAHDISDVRGYSTHISIQLPPHLIHQASWLAASTVGPALTLLIDSCTSPGLMCRPRRGRLEIAGEYVDDPTQLLAAITFLAGCARIWKNTSADPPGGWPSFEVRHWEYGQQRGGIYLPPDAYGPHLHQRGRDTMLPMASGGAISAQACLTFYSDAILDALGPVAREGAAALRTATADFGALQMDHRPCDASRVVRRPAHRQPTRLARAFGTIPARSAAVGLKPVFVCWDGAAFACGTHSPHPYVAVPAEMAQELVDAAGTGDITRVIPADSSPRKVLRRRDQFKDAAFYLRVDRDELRKDDDFGKKPPPVVRRDHYLSYCTCRRENVQVTLEDRFLTPRAPRFLVSKLRRLVVPTRKIIDDESFAVVDEETHLTEYEILPLEPIRLNPPTRLLLRNQFGELIVEIVGPDRLLVPASKGLDGPKPPPLPDEHDIDHYTGYRVRLLQHAEEHFRVEVENQFIDSPREIEVLYSKRLYVPVRKNDEEVKNPDELLLNYYVRDVDKRPWWRFCCWCWLCCCGLCGRLLFTADQFRLRKIKVRTKCPEELYLPTTIQPLLVSPSLPRPFPKPVWFRFWRWLCRWLRRLCEWLFCR